jgi:4-amino-4-deoxy-L-arabinose transferase-like glycosyltransferase
VSRPDLRPFLLASLGLTALALIVRAPLFGHGIAASDTTGAYLPVAHAIREGKGFLNDFRPPGFPLALAGFEELGLNPVNGVVALQHLLGILLPTALLLIGWRYFDPLVGILAGLLAAASPLMTVTEQVALPDYLFGLLYLLGAVLLVEAALRLRRSEMPWKTLASAGVVYGLATMVRPNGQLALLLIPLALLVATRDWRRWLRACGIAAAAFAVMLAPWVLHNAVEYDEPVVSSEGGVALYGREITSERNPPPTDTADGRLAHAVYATGAPTVAVLNAFVNEGKTLAGASGAMGALAREAIRRDPAGYLVDTGQIVSEYLDIYDPHTFTADPERDQIAQLRRNIGSSEEGGSVPGDSPLTRVPWQLAQPLDKLVYIAALGGLLVLLLPFAGAPRSRLAGAILAIAAGLGLLTQAMLVRFELRFGVTYAPILWILFAAAAVLSVRFLVETVRNRSWRRLRA